MVGKHLFGKELRFPSKSNHCQQHSIWQRVVLWHGLPQSKCFTLQGNLWQSLNRIAICSSQDTSLCCCCCLMPLNFQKTSTMSFQRQKKV